MQVPQPIYDYLGQEAEYQVEKEASQEYSASLGKAAIFRHFKISRLAFCI